MEQVTTDEITITEMVAELKNTITTLFPDRDPTFQPLLDQVYVKSVNKSWLDVAALISKQLQKHCTYKMQEKEW